jgi:hypothetical protein
MVILYLYAYQCQRLANPIRINNIKQLAFWGWVQSHETGDRDSLWHWVYHIETSKHGHVETPILCGKVSFCENSWNYHGMAMIFQL